MVGSGDATVSGLKLLSSSQAVGLLAVLAVSGSVALITIGKQKLWHHQQQEEIGIVDDGGDDESDSAVDCNDENLLSEYNIMAQQQSSLQSSSSSFKNKKSALSSGKQSVVKKVRFAPDVVEPTGDGREYRWRQKSIRECKQEVKPACQKENAGANQASVQAHKPQILVKPNLPANRMVLYNGMQRYKSLRALHCMS